MSASSVINVEPDLRCRFETVNCTGLMCGNVRTEPEFAAKIELSLPVTAPDSN